MNSRARHHADRLRAQCKALMLRHCQRIMHLPEEHRTMRDDSPYNTDSTRYPESVRQRAIRELVADGVLVGPMYHPASNYAYYKVAPLVLAYPY